MRRIYASSKLVLLMLCGAGGERWPVWNELLAFPLDACAAPSLAPQPDAAGAAAPLTPLRVSVRHRSVTVFQRDSVIAEATVPLPAVEALATPGAPASRPQTPRRHARASSRA